MAKEKVEDLSTEKLLKRKKFFTLIGGIYLGIVLVFIGLIIYDLIDNGSVERTTLTSAIPIFATIWIPVIFLREINTELKRRGVK